METVIIVIIILCILIGIIKAIFEWVKEFMQEHLYLGIAIIAVIACLIFTDRDIALRVAIGFIAVWLVWKGFLKVLNLIQKMRENQLWRWMDRHCSMLGKTSAKRILDGGTQIKIPDTFKRYVYSNGRSCQYVVASFLDFKQKALESKVKNAIYGELSNAGMLDDADVLGCISSAFNGATRTKDLSVICSESIDLLIKEGNLDRPIPGEKILHCVGATVGTNFESEELSI